MLAGTLRLSCARARPSFTGVLVLFPTDLTSFLELIRQNHDAIYGLMFAYATSHSLLLAMFAGYAAHAGALNLGTLIIVCWIGSFVGDVVRFWVGRRFGIGWLGSYPRLQRGMQTAAHLAARHHVWMILIHRYPHGIRGLAGFAYGVSTLSWPSFLVMNFIAAGIWSVAVVYAGYAFGEVSEKFMSQASSGLGAFMLIAFLGLSWVLSRRLERAIERS
jgi:membrane protein DedA with SNARE-associated domain